MFLCPCFPSSLFLGLVLLIDISSELQVLFSCLTECLVIFFLIPDIKNLILLVPRFCYIPIVLGFVLALSVL